MGSGRHPGTRAGWLGLAPPVNRNRIVALQWWMAAAAVMVWGRLFQLQISEHGYWKERGEQLRIWHEILPARRGRLLDRQRLELADNQPWVGSQALTPALQARLAEQGRDPSIWARRHYPMGSLFSHVIGYVSEEHTEKGDWRGRDGLELSLEKRLRGFDGSQRWLVTAQGRRLRLLQEEPARAGEDVSLSLDARVQASAHAALSSVLTQLSQVRTSQDQPAGAVVALKPDTGEILAMVSLPDFDPNLMVRPGLQQQAQLRQMLTSGQAPLLNRAIAAQVPPASTFKIVTSSAALNCGLIGPDRSFSCSGVRWVGGVPFHCFVRSGHGQLRFEDTLAYSCDCAYYDLGLELGGQRLEHWARQWGLGSLTGVGLPGEEPGWVPDGRKSHLGEVANLSIGQGALLVTPLQMARVAAGVANRGRLPLPHLTSTLPVRPPSDPPIALDEAQWQRLQAGLAGTVERGTAAGAVLNSQMPRGTTLYGKTGTVENQPSHYNPRGYNHTWFVGYSQHPALAVAVYVERSGGYGGGLAAPIAVRVIKTWAEIEEKSMVR